MSEYQANMKVSFLYEGTPEATKFNFEDPVSMDLYDLREAVYTALHMVHPLLRYC